MQKKHVRTKYISNMILDYFPLYFFFMSHSLGAIYRRHAGAEITWLYQLWIFYENKNHLYFATL